MAFWGGIKKIISGIEEIASTPSEVFSEIRYKRREALSGKYTVTIPAQYGHPALVAHIMFHGGSNMHDINLITYDGGSSDIWDDLSDNAKLHANGQIRHFLSELMEKHRVSSS